MSKIKSSGEYSYKYLNVWQKSMDLVEGIYKITKGFPKQEQYGLTRQIRRAVISIPSNIAEGAGRKTLKDYLRFLYIAMGSANELETQIELAVRLSFMNENTEISQQIFFIKLSLSRLIKSINRKINNEEKGNV